MARYPWVAEGRLPTPEEAASFRRECAESVIRGFSVLGRPGITFSREQEDRIRALASSGQGGEARQIILDELEKRA